MGDSLSSGEGTYPPYASGTDSPGTNVCHRSPSSYSAQYAGMSINSYSLVNVACSGAGADDLVASADLAPNIPIVRAVDPLQGVRMAQYVALMALRHYRGLVQLEQQQREVRWSRPPPPAERDFPGERTSPFTRPPPMPNAPAFARANVVARTGPAWPSAMLPQ